LVIILISKINRYATGKIEFEELLSMKRKVLNYSLELEKARADKQASIAFIHYLMGNLKNISR
jgi:cobalt-zinc-cadmium efflux system outer membrane protein